MEDADYVELKRQEQRAQEDEDFVLGDDDKSENEANSEAASEDLENSLESLDVVDEDEDSLFEESIDNGEGPADGGKRDVEEVHRRARAIQRAKRNKRNKFIAFNMPKISELRKAAGLIPRTPPQKKRKKAKKSGNNEDGDDEDEQKENINVIGELIDSAKEVLAYFAGEESYEVRPLTIWDTPEILENIYYTQRRRLLITWLPKRYTLNLSGFRRYYKPATEVLLVACRAKFVKPFYVADLLEEGANPNVQEEGTTNRPLHFLCRRGNYQGVKFLIEAGADVNAKNASRRTALMSACDTARTGPQVRIVRYLLKQPGVKATLEARDNGGNTAAMNAIFKGNVWILRELLLAGARVTEDDPYWGYESAHHVSCWVYAAGLLSEIDQLPATSLQDDWSKMSLRWRFTAPKGHYKYFPLLWVQTLYKYNAELCFRMCQNKKRREDATVYPPRPKREVIIMAEKKRDDRRKRRLDREEARKRKERNNMKLVNRKLSNEVKEVEDWNMKRQLMAKSIDTAYEKGLRGQKDQSTYEWVLKQHLDRKSGQVDESHWEMAPRTGSHYISPAPKLPKTKFSEFELGRVLEERHNRAANPNDRIHIYSGGTAEDAYARASWVERDIKQSQKVAPNLFSKKEKTKKAGDDSEAGIQFIGDSDDEDAVEFGEDGNPAIADARGSPGRLNGWKLAKRAGTLGFVDSSTQWAKNKLARPFMVPPTEDEVYLSDEEESKMIFPV